MRVVGFGGVGFMWVSWRVQSCGGWCNIVFSSSLGIFRLGLRAWVGFVARGRFVLWVLFGGG